MNRLRFMKVDRMHILHVKGLVHLSELIRSVRFLRQGTGPAEYGWAHQNSSHHAEPCGGPWSIRLKKQKKLSVAVATKTLGYGIETKIQSPHNSSQCGPIRWKNQKDQSKEGDTFNIEMAQIMTHWTSTIWERNRDTWSSSVARQKREADLHAS